MKIILNYPFTFMRSLLAMKLISGITVSLLCSKAVSGQASLERKRDGSLPAAAITVNAFEIDKTAKLTEDEEIFLRLLQAENSFSMPTPAPTPVTAPFPTPAPTSAPVKAPSAPTSAPVKAPTGFDGDCVNDSDYRWNGSKNQSCKWIRNIESRRQEYCREQGVRDACPQSCGLCCENDSSYTFTSSEGRVRGCWYVGRTAEQKQKYCDKYLNKRMVRDACPVSCDRCFDPVNPAPSPSPPTTSPPTTENCINDHDWTLDGKPRITCKWIRNKESRRDIYCPQAAIKEACPQSCGICCKNELQYNFDVNGVAEGCAWVAQGRQKEYCKTFRSGRMVRDACPESCDRCLDPVNPAPTPAPPPTNINCINDHDWTLDGKPLVTCRWIRNKESRRQEYCPQASIKEACPQSCGICCANELQYNFDVNGVAEGCAWVAQGRQKEYCKTFRSGRMVRDACPVSCDRCMQPIP